MSLITPKDGWRGDELAKPPDAAGADDTGAIMFCPQCRAEYRPGFTTCSDCQIDLVPPAALSAAEEAEDQESTEKAASVSSPALKCVQHPGVDAAAQCRGCFSGVCNTCDFTIGGRHFCPECMDKAGDEPISARRKRLSVAALISAVYCTVMGVWMYSGALYQALVSTGNAAAVGLVATYGVYIPSVVGTALAFVPMERRLKNTRLMWTAVTWNAVLTVIFVIVEIASQILLR